MILRRVIEHVREQNWTAIAIDFVIVVVGVFVGIQVSNWNDERATRQKSVVFTERLKADLREEAFFYRYLIEYNKDVLSSAEKAVKALNGKAPLSNEQLLIEAYRATQYKQPQRFRASYDELISTGSIGLIRDERLRGFAIRMYNVPTMDNFVREGVQSKYREVFRMTVDNEIQRALSQQCGDRFVERGDYQAILDVIDYPCTLDLPQSEIDAAAQSLRDNPMVIAYLRVRIADIATRLNDMVSNNKDILEGLGTLSGQNP